MGTLSRLHPSGQTTAMDSTETIVMQLVVYVGTNGAKKDKHIYFNFWGLHLQNMIQVKVKHIIAVSSLRIVTNSSFSLV